MIQRIQSIYLLLVVVICIVASLYQTTYLSVMMHSNLDKGNYTAEVGLVQQTVISSSGTYTDYDNKKLIALGVIGLMALGCIFMYKNRTKQIRFVRLNIILSLMFLLGMMYFAYKYVQSDDVMLINDYTIRPLGLALIGVIILLNTLALIQIKKDDKLVKSADRFR